MTACPLCRLETIVAGERCPNCGASPEDRARLTAIAARRSEITAAQRALLNEDAVLAVEARQVTRRVRLADDASVEPGDAVVPREPSLGRSGRAEPVAGRWRTERVRDALLWLGGGLLALSAISLAAVLWSRDQPAGKPLLTAARLTVLLLVVTLAVAMVTRVIARRLPATAEVTGTLMLALAGTDWYVARRAGVGRDLMSIEAWIATGAFVLGALAVVQRRVLRLRAPLVSAPMLGLAGLGVAVLPLATDSTIVSVLATLCSALCVVGASGALRTRTWSGAAITLISGAAAFEITGAAFALTTLSTITENGIGGGDRGLALAVLALAIPFVVLLVLGRQHLARVAGAIEVVKASVAFAVMAAGAVALVVCMDVSPFLTAMAWLGGATAAVGLARPRLGWGVTSVGLGALGVGSTLIVARGVNALFVPLSWWTEPWSLSVSATARDHLSPLDPPVFHGWWWAIAAALGVVISGIIVVRSASPRLRPMVSSAASAIAVASALIAVTCLLPMAAAAPVWLVLVVELIVAAGLIVVVAGLEVSKLPLAVGLGAAAAVVAFGASGWALSSVAATVAYFVAISIVTAFACVRSSVPGFRRGMIAISAAAGVTAVACVVAGATRGLGPTGFATSCTGAALVLAATLEPRARHLAIEGVGIAGTLIGVAYVAGSPGWLAGAVTVGAIAAAGAAVSGGALFGNRPYRLALPVIVVLAGDAWLAAAGIVAVEAYTIPLGAAFVIVGATARNWYSELGSWGSYSLGLVVALLPSLVILLDRGGSLRLIGLIAAGTLSVLAGAAYRLQAPMLLGAAVVVTIAIDALSPVAAGLPRWIPLGTAGLVILWIGITFERRLNDARHLRNNIRSLR